ncbi:hypothetical protein PTTG_28615 [Puccinia triticina 1-1 BBBD Race 1]|uniref:Secreted protein n=2 Tax=Puccinia triticina TaxID=208348 RepID=A0A180GAK0_PUCT1|nr:uncharacterized protein PtA15_13A360 [Puccinia triticina]OAV89701.1 hypothetical protein PTTG_28615 [Puccinia triticina 1-1 BBBD Race 1]WAQ90960.1 hypothetical protein PtA15_13A360 [Puccinia triticina]WAR61148.1 hypothetical protein PtB15_13B400 [Puccinia triticina]
MHLAKLWILLVVHSPAAYSRFRCNDGSEPDSVQGVCVKPIDLLTDPHKVPEYLKPRLINKNYIVMDATWLFDDRYTCKDLKVADVAPPERYCCIREPEEISKYTRSKTHQEMADLHCYTRDGKKKSR